MSTLVGEAEKQAEIQRQKNDEALRIALGEDPGQSTGLGAALGNTAPGNAYYEAVNNILAKRKAGGVVDIPTELDQNKLLKLLASTLAGRRQPGEVSQGSPLQVSGESGVVTWNR